MRSDVSVVALISAYNEADIIESVVADLIRQQVQVYLFDDGSTDGTAAIVERYAGRGLLAVERLTPESPADTKAAFDWERILRRKAELARELDADWFIHHDADEFRESPWANLTLAEAIGHVDALGYNAIDFAGFDFRPTRDDFHPGGDVREAFTSFAEPAEYDRVQIRCWKKTGAVDLVSSGGHDASFPERRVFPIRFILRHYPIRGQAHGERKVFHERRSRFRAAERERGWHVHNDNVIEGTSFIEDPAGLKPYDGDRARIDLAVRHRGVEELQQSLAAGERTIRALMTSNGELAVAIAALEQAMGVRTHDLDVTRQDLALTRQELGIARDRVAQLEIALADATGRAAHAAARWEAERQRTDHLQQALNDRAAESDRWRHSVDDLLARLQAFERSRTWRWTAPARALVRLLTGTSG